jgi:hypothetical protein
MATRQDLYYDKMPPVTFAAANGQLRPNIDIIQQVLTLLRTVEVNQLPPVSPIIGSAVAEIVSYYIPSFGSIQKRNEYQILSRDVLNHKAKLLNHKTLMKLYTQLCSQHNNSIAKAVEYNTPS